MSDPKPSEVNPDSNIVISVDAMGGDSGPGAVIAGLSIALKSYPNIKYLVHGQKNLLQNLVQQENLGQVCTIIDADRVVSMNDKPVSYTHLTLPTTAIV